jgi:hypothetical protein
MRKITLEDRGSMKEKYPSLCASPDFPRCSMTLIHLFSMYSVHGKCGIQFASLVTYRFCCVMHTCSQVGQFSEEVNAEELKQELNKIEPF